MAQQASPATVPTSSITRTLACSWRTVTSLSVTGGLRPAKVDENRFDDENNNRAIEVTHPNPSQIVWQYGSGNPNINEPVSGVACASRLENGNTLITDSNHSRIVEIDPKKSVVWEYFTCTGTGCNLQRGTGPLPTRAVRLKNGHTLISDKYNHRFIEVNHGKQIVRTFGKLGALGYNTESVADGGLNSPYDAKRTGDLTGLTLPREDEY